MLARLLNALRRKPPRRAGPSVRRAQPALWGPATGAVLVSYAPNSDGRADPGEVVWTWVAFEDDPSNGKDRPVLLIGRRGGWFAGLLLTSKQPGNGPRGAFMDVGNGAWDRQGRPSQVRLDRLLDVDPARVRRQGAAVDRALFDRVVEAARPYHVELR